MLMTGAPPPALQMHLRCTLHTPEWQPHTHTDGTNLLVMERTWLVTELKLDYMQSGLWCAMMAL